jgi:S-adenosylmethionine:tRNA ribosyltransferase-isomerase
MVVDRRRQSIEHFHVRDLPELLPAGDRLVLNDTKVIPAHLVGQRVPSGGRWQGLYLETTGEGHWKLLCKSRGKIKPGDAVTLMDVDGRPSVKLWLIEPLEEGQWLAHPDSDEPAEVVLGRVGRVPLPPYIRGGQMVDADVTNYQTVFARVPGAVAAPTAGLHFTKDLLRTLSERAATGAAGMRRIAFGTMVTRVLETAVRAPGASRENFVPWQGETDLFIRPPFEFQAIDALLTNFHFPRTTLLVLVETLAGRDLISRAYHEAIKEEYRFYSYGDAMLIL